MISFLKFIRGYVILSLTGPMVTRFLNQCISQKLLFWNVKRVEDSVLVCVSRSSLGKIKDISKKTNTKIEIVKRCGLPYLFKKYKKRSVFLFAFLISLIMLYVMSLFLWDITIEGNESYKKEEIMKFITSEYAHGGQRLSTIKPLVLEERLRTHFDKFAWVSCEIKGTRLIVHIKETVPLAKTRKETAPCDLIANKDGIITSIITRSGTALVEQGNTVKKGDILISGVISYQNDSKEVYEEAYVPADGDIKCKTVYDYNDSIPLAYYERIPVKRYHTSYKINLFGSSWELFALDNSKQEYILKDKKYQFKLGKTFYFPVSVERRQYFSCKITQKRYTNEEAKALAKAHLEKFCDNLCKKGVEIVENNVTIKISGENLSSSGKLVVIEPIG